MHTDKDLQVITENVNIDLFEDKLPLDNIRSHILPARFIEALCNRPVCGVCIPTHDDKYIIFITKEQNTTEIFDTMIHELIHVYLMEKTGYSGHGKPFKKICQRATEIYYPQ
jgi:Zn-dependent peptidase ImmA (M78 family)